MPFVEPQLVTVVQHIMWGLALCAWCYAWWSCVRWYRYSNGSAPLARSIVVASTLQTIVTVIAFILIPFIPARNMWIDWVTLLLPLIQIATALSIWNGGRWMHTAPH